MLEILKTDLFEDIKIYSIHIGNLLKISFFNLHEKLVNSLRYLENLTYTLKKLNPSIIVTLSGNDIIDELAVRIAKNQKIPTIYVPHSIMALTYERSPLQHDYLGCAGEHKLRLFNSWGMKESSLKLIGIPLYDKLYRKYSTIKDFDEIRKRIIDKFSINPSNKIILLVTSHQEDFMRELIFNSVVNVVNSHNDYELIVKIHPIEENLFYQKLQKKIGDKEAHIIKEYDLHDLIIASDLVVGRNTGAQIEAILFEKDVINLSYKTKSDIHLMATFGAVINVLEPEELDIAIEEVLFNSEVIESLKNGRKKYIKSVLYKFDGKASARVKEIINEVLSISE